MRVIDASKLMLIELSDGNYLLTKEAMHNAPTFETESIIYCKDCEFYGYGLCHLIYHAINNKSVASRQEHDFCSRVVPRGRYR